MASSSSSPQQPPSSTTTVDYPDPPLGVPLLLPAPPLQPPPPPPRRLPPPCWTPDETSALIDAYREKWYSLRRGNLRAAHWQDVAEQIHRLCPDVTPPKTAVQCRHKMEKLRKRYRAELQRAKSIPHHRFSSAWLYFSKMDSMEKGATVSSSPSPTPNQHLLLSSSPVVVADDFVNHEFHDDHNDNGNDNNDEDYRGSSFPKRNGLRIRIANTNSRNNYQESPNPNPNPNPNRNSNSNPNSKFGHKSRFPEFSTPPQFEERQRFAPRFVNNGGSSGGGGASSGGSGGIGSSSGMGMGMGMNLIKKKRSALGRKRVRESDKGDKVATEMVEVIRVLGDGFLRTEMMKMEMIRESERIRMENEMKRTQMFLQSQHNLIETFIKGCSDLIASNRDNDNDDDDDDHHTNNTTTKDAS